MSSQAFAFDVFVVKNESGEFWLSHVIHDHEFNSRTGKLFLAVLRAPQPQPLPPDALDVAAAASPATYRLQTFHLFTRCDQAPSLELVRSDFLNGDYDDVGQGEESWLNSGSSRPVLFHPKSNG